MLSMSFSYAGAYIYKFIKFIKNINLLNDPNGEINSALIFEFEKIIEKR